ncbi:hypothetical protein CYMTET_29849 [Cymbomonas tetramitiformis]|uniref:Uncharacterized protein n=1 Tax=Cymbomonas tetramitiformis TaxID=36881 RepID=A0AAE0FK53_9CHLO|nr:hypothetical protein CYMTET_29849 [Cymbomonas tetramitiformis]
MEGAETSERYPSIYTMIKCGMNSTNVHKCTVQFIVGFEWADLVNMKLEQIPVVFQPTLSDNGISPGVIPGCKHSPTSTPQDKCTYSRTVVEDVLNARVKRKLVTEGVDPKELIGEFASVYAKRSTNNVSKMPSKGALKQMRLSEKEHLHKRSGDKHASSLHEVKSEIEEADPDDEGRRAKKDLGIYFCESGDISKGIALHPDHEENEMSMFAANISGGMQAFGEAPAFSAFFAFIARGDAASILGVLNRVGEIEMEVTNVVERAAPGNYMKDHCRAVAVATAFYFFQKKPGEHAQIVYKCLMAGPNELRDPYVVPDHPSMANSQEELLRQARLCRMFDEGVRMLSSGVQ